MSTMGEDNYKDRLTLSLVSQEIVNFAGGSVIRNDVETLVVHVQNQVLTLQNGNRQ